MMKCFQCKEEISDEVQATHIGDSDFVHPNCKEKFEEERDEFFQNVGDDNWYKYIFKIIYTHLSGSYQKDIEALVDKSFTLLISPLFKI